MVVLLVIVLGYYIIRHYLKGKNAPISFDVRKAYLNNVLIPIGNIHIHREGEFNPKRPSIIVANHRNFVDVVIFKWIDAFIIAKAEIASYPVINKGAEISGIVWVKRQSRKSRADTKSKISEIIDNGYHLCLFPEGTTNRGSRVLPLKKGSFTVAAEHNIPVIPVTLEFRDKKDIWYADESMIQLFLKQFSKWRTEVKVVFGEPLEGETGEELAIACENEFNKNLERMQEGWSRMF